MNSIRYKLRLCWSESILEGACPWLPPTTGSMPLVTPNHSSKTCGGPEALTSTITFKQSGLRCGLGGCNPTSSPCDMWYGIRGSGQVFAEHNYLCGLLMYAGHVCSWLRIIPDLLFEFCHSVEMLL